MTEPLKPTVSKRTFSERFVREIRKNWGLYLLVSIPLLYLILFKYWPMYGVQIAFRNYSPARSIANSPWVGLKYFQKFMGNYQFKRILGNTIAISLYSLLTFPLPILLAVLLNYVTRPRFKKTVQMISYMPHFISTVVMVGIILQFLDVRSGMLNMLLTALGREPVNFMAKPAYFRTIYILSGVWQSLGYNSIIYIAALSGVSPELHEAAIVDGANILKRIWHVDLPGILPTISILLIMQCGSILSVGYEKIYLMQNSLNLSVSEIISTYVYKQGLTGKTDFSYSTAINLFNSVINMVLITSVNWISRKVGETSLW